MAAVLVQRLVVFLAWLLSGELWFADAMESSGLGSPIRRVCGIDVPWRIVLERLFPRNDGNGVP